MKKNSSLLMIVGVLGVIVVGVSFAFYIASVTITGTGQRVTGNTANPYTVVYDAGTNRLESTELTPNHSVSKDFSVKVNSVTGGSGTVTYAIKFDITDNTFVKCTDDNYNSVSNACSKNAEELVYTLKDGSGNVLKTGDITGYVGTIVMIKETKNTNVTATYNYTLEIAFKETNADQNHNMNKTITGSVEVEFATLDETIPVVDSINVTNTTRDSIAVSVTAHDMETVDTEGVVTKYYYSINDGAYVEKATNTHTFEGLEAGKKYNIKVQVEDNAGNKSEVKTIETSTKGAASTIIGDNTVLEGTDSFTKGATTAADSGLFSTIDDDGTTYYYRGIHASVDNWVDFAGFKWRIIRINGDGSIRMIYNGTSTATTGDGTQLGTRVYNTNYDNNMYVGFRYTSGQVHGTGTPSTILGADNSTDATTLNGFYNTKIKGTQYEQYIDQNAGFCNDRTPSTSSTTSNGSGGTGTTTTYYGAYIRLIPGGSWASTQKVTMKCNESDLFTATTSNKGNKSLANPIGLVTVDEVVYAGGFGGKSNGSYWLYTYQYYWTMSPYFYNDNPANYARVFFVRDDGSLNRGDLNSERGLRPVINLKADTPLTGSGTTSNPFRIAS